jgi:hypothetical protein
MSLSLFGNDVFESYPELLPISQHKNKFVPKLQAIILRTKLFFISGFLIDRDMKLGVDTLDRMKMKLSNQNLYRLKTASDVYDLIKRELENFEKMIYSHYAASTNSILYSIIAFSIITRNAKKLNTQHQRDITTILSSIGNVESANIPEMLRDIAQTITNADKGQEFLAIDDGIAVDWMKGNCPDAYKLFEKFMERHGHRALKEFDVYVKTWAMQPELVIDMIKTNVRMPSNMKTKNEKLNADKVVQQLKTPLNGVSKAIMKILIPRCHRGVQLREEAKTKLILAVDLLRKAFIYLSKKMMHEGLLPHKDLIFHLTFHELKVLIKTRDSMLINKAIRREKMHPKLDELEFEEVSFGVPKPISDRKDGEIISDSDVLASG